MIAQLEHANYTVKDPDATAAWMCDLFGWKIRWSGAGMTTGRTVHVGTDTHYVALFSYNDAAKAPIDSYHTIGGLNHIAVTVDNLAAMETAVRVAGFTPDKHQDYEPGQRFYFHDHDNIEYEVVCYA